MLAPLNRRFAREDQPKASAPRTQAGPGRGAAGALRYPPADPGLCPRTPEQVLMANGDLLRRMRLHAATDEAQFEMAFRAPLLRLAQQVNVLPATATSLFAGEMGLIRACMETAFFSFQAADGRIFTATEGVERRHALEGRWRYLCFLAALLLPLGRTLERIVVTDPEGRVWPRHFAGLSDWCAQHAIERVFVAWGAPDGDGDLGPSHATLALLPQVVGRDNLQQLDDAQAGLVTALHHLAVGEAGPAPIAHQVVNSCWQRILRREAARRPQAFGRLTVGTHLGPYLAGALRTLVEEGRWTPNASVLKADAQGLYLQWPEAAAELIAFGRARGYPAWPGDAATLQALLQASGLVQHAGRELGRLSLVDDAGEILEALQLANPASILEDFDPRDWSRSGAGTWRRLAPAASRPLPPASIQRTPAQGAAPGPPMQDLFAEDPPTQGEPTASPVSMHAHPKQRGAVELSEATAPTPAVAHEQPGGPQTPPPGEASMHSATPPDPVPADLAAIIGTPAQVELLRRVVSTWRERGQDSAVMRRIDDGAAIEFAFLTTLVKDAPTWVDCMARAGLVHAPAKTPGLRIQKVVLTEGRPPMPAVVLSNLACRRLGL